MSWFAAHAIMYVRFKAGAQEVFPVWENVLLIEAAAPSEVWQKAVARAREDEGDCGGSFRWGDRPAEWVFAGLRKVVAVSHQGANDRLGDGDEITYSEFQVPDQADLQRLVSGEEVAVRYVE